jgi:predicted MFS family arabinose efflux permease
MLFGLLGDKWFQKDQRAKVMIALFCNAFPIIFVISFLSVDFRAADGASMQDIFAIPGFWIIIVSIVIAMFINQGVGPNWLSSIVEINLPEHRATMLSIASFMDLLGKSLGPLVGSYIQSAYGIKTAMWSVVIFWVINIFIWIPVFFYIQNDIKKVHTTLAKRASDLQAKPAE